MKSPQFSRFGIMAQNDGLQKHIDNLRIPTSPIVEHHMGDASKGSPHASPRFRRDQYPEDDHTPHRKSVLSKVKEKARKLRYSLSGKKRHSEGENMTLSRGVTLEVDEEEEEEEDAEYLGAPSTILKPYNAFNRNDFILLFLVQQVYESELAPEIYKENARLHPRLIPVISEKHVLSSSIKENEKAPAPIKMVNGQENEKPPNPPTPSKALTETVPEKHNSPNKTLTETVTEKLAPAYFTLSEATHAIASKIQGLTVSTPSAPETKNHITLESNKQDNLTILKQSLPEIKTKTSPEAEKQESPTGQIWDKGVSVKEYIMNKLEPGEEDRALSKVITDVMSPKKSPREEGVVGKMKEAVTSFIWHEESPQSSVTQSPTNAHTNASTSIPASTDANEVFEEANEGRVLQEN